MVSAWITIISLEIMYVWVLNLAACFDPVHLLAIAAILMCTSVCTSQSWSDYSTLSFVQLAFQMFTNCIDKICLLLISEVSSQIDSMLACYKLSLQIATTCTWLQSCSTVCLLLFILYHVSSFSMIVVNLWLMGPLLYWCCDWWCPVVLSAMEWHLKVIVNTYTVWYAYFIHTYFWCCQVDDCTCWMPVSDLILEWSFIIMLMKCSIFYKDKPWFLST